jgi:hypothetical protein
MGLSLKKEEMISFLENVKIPGETFRHMLWGTATSTDLMSFQNRSAASIIIFFTASAGVSGSLIQAFCYIGMTDTSLYVVALDAYNTSQIVGTFTLPYANITSLKIRKTALGASHTIEIDIEGGGFISLVVKGISIGTDIKDQKERMAGFLAAIEGWKK